MSTVPPLGDVASLSGLGGHLRTTAAALVARAAEVEESERLLASLWAGRASLTHRRRAQSVRAVTLEVASLLDEAGSALQAHAATVAEIAAEIDRVRARAGSLGLVEVDGRLVSGLRVAGEAQSEARREEEVVHLQARLDRCRHHAGRARSRLSATLGPLTEGLLALG